MIQHLVEDKHADYLFTAAKDNQLDLFAALDALGSPRSCISPVTEARGI